LTTEPYFTLNAQTDSLKLETIITMKKNKGRRDFIPQVIFYNKGRRVTDLKELDEEEFETLVKKYKNQSAEDIKKNNDVLFLESNSKSEKSGLLKRIRNIFLGPLLKRIRNIFLEFEIVTNTLNVIMVDYNKQPLARTTIELDADVITILRPDLDSKNMKMLLKVQGINVYLINRILNEQLLQFVKTLHNTIRNIKLVFVAAGTVGSIVDLTFLTNSYFEKTQTMQNYDLAKLLQDPIIIQLIILQLLILVVIPFAVKYGKEIVLWIIKKQVGKHMQ